MKSHRAKGKRVTTFAVDHLEFVEPLDKDPQISGNGNDGDEVDEENSAEQPNGEHAGNETCGLANGESVIGRSRQ